MAKPRHRQIVPQNLQSVEIEATIERLGASGDGIASFTLNLPGGEDGAPVNSEQTRKLYIAYSLPGERVTAKLVAREGDGYRADLLSIIEKSPHRIAPACRHFGECGGCLLQHQSESFNNQLKTDRIVIGLVNRGWNAELLPLKPILALPAGERRRATFSARHFDEGMKIGFNQRGQHRLIDIEECPVLLPELFALVAPLREVLAQLLPPRISADLLVTSSDSGIELVIRAHDRSPRAHRRSNKPAAMDNRLLQLRRELLGEFAHSHNLARVIWQSAGKRPETISETRQPTVSHGGITVPLPMGGFLQATKSGEALIVHEVLAALSGLSKTTKILDLYAGSGTLSLPLIAAGYEVMAIEGDPSACASLESVAKTNGNQFQNRLKVAQRDLLHYPLLPAELNGYGAVVLDPPRVGAWQQVQQIAQSEITRLVYVSCGPESFARDATSLKEAGFEMQSLQPIDQFVWSPHVELVAAFHRDS